MRFNEMTASAAKVVKFGVLLGGGAHYWTLTSCICQETLSAHTSAYKLVSLRKFKPLRGDLRSGADIQVHPWASRATWPLYATACD